jgi:DNA mismatch repair ATPase MutS
MGLVATHDVALAALEQERPARIHNVHFTDVVEQGEMRFDYKLRPGVVRTSNALRLLAMAGIDVPDEDALQDSASVLPAPLGRSPREIA